MYELSSTTKEKRFWEHRAMKDFYNLYANPSAYSSPIPKTLSVNKT